MAQSKASPKSHVGMVRTGNEDCFFSDDNLGLWLVADGMGGHEAGEVASAIVAETISGAVREGIDLNTAVQFSHRVEQRRGRVQRHQMARAGDDPQPRAGDQ